MSSLNGKETGIQAVNVCGKRIFDYLAECLAKFNRGADSLLLRTVSGSESTAVEVANILKNSFNITIGKTSINTLKIGDISQSSMEIQLEYEPGSREGPESEEVLSYKNFSGNYRHGYVGFIAYNLLLDSMLSGCEKIEISRSGGTHAGPLPLLSVKTSGDGMSWSCRTESEEAAGNLLDAYYRAGILLSPGWKEVAGKLSRFDDVILGVDTNLLYSAALTEQVLPSLTIIDPKEYVHTPNWIYIIIPHAVMHEIEQAANHRYENKLNYIGRMGFRALQEIMELDNNADLAGVAISIVGEVEPALDARIELQGLRKDLQRAGKKSRDDDMALSDRDLKISGKMSTGDTFIRDQFRGFLRQLGFHKASYFLTADKSHAALARAEGLQSIYYRHPYPDRASGEVKHPSISACINGGESAEINFTIPLGKLIYELAVQFGSISVKGKDPRDNTDIQVQISCDTLGDTLDHWLKRELKIEKSDFVKLENAYSKNSRFPLNKVLSEYNKINKLIDQTELY